MRSDVDALYTESRMEELFKYYRRKNREERNDTPFELGNLHCTTHFYDDALMFHFTQGEAVGTVITLAPEAGRNIIRFITECLRILHSDSPQTIGAAPTWIRD